MDQSIDVVLIVRGLSGGVVGGSVVAFKTCEIALFILESFQNGFTFSGFVHEEL